MNDIKKYGWYSLKKGEKLKIVRKRDSIFDCPLKNGPSEIRVVKEYPYFIDCEASYYGDDPATFRFCINKSDLLCKHSTIEREETGELLKYNSPVFID